MYLVLFNAYLHLQSAESWQRPFSSWMRQVRGHPARLPRGQGCRVALREASTNGIVSRSVLGVLSGVCTWPAAGRSWRRESMRRKRRGAGSSAGPCARLGPALGNPRAEPTWMLRAHARVRPSPVPAWGKTVWWPGPCHLPAMTWDRWTLPSSCPQHDGGDRLDAVPAPENVVVGIHEINPVSCAGPWVRSAVHDGCYSPVGENLFTVSGAGWLAPEPTMSGLRCRPLTPPPLSLSLLGLLVPLVLPPAWLVLGAEQSCCLGTSRSGERPSPLGNVAYDHPSTGILASPGLASLS